MASTDLPVPAPDARPDAPPNAGGSVPAGPGITASGVRLAKTPFAETVLVCAKCAKKFRGEGKSVAKQLKAELKGRAWGKVRVVETKCFDLCPKRRQVLASARTLQAHRLLVVEPGFRARAALEQLLGPPATPPEG